MFSEEEIREFKEDGFTDEEIEAIADAFALKQTIDMIPEDIESFAKEYQEKITASENQGMLGFFELAKKDPEFFQKMIALDIALAGETEKQEIKQEEKSLESQLSDADYETAKSNFAETILSLSDSDRKEFMKLIANITPEQKADIVARLLKK